MMFEIYRVDEVRNGMFFILGYFLNKEDAIAYAEGGLVELPARVEKLTITKSETVAEIGEETLQ